MKIAVIGTGYVGLVTGTCFAESGNDVTCVDINASKVARLQKGEIPIYEPGLQELVSRNVEHGRLNFTTDTASAVKGAMLVYLAVGTPSADDGSADLSGLWAAVKSFAAQLERDAIVVTKSTVPVGTCAAIYKLLQQLTGRECDVASNPEFLKEGAAINDFMYPDRVVVGVRTKYAEELLRMLYSPFLRTDKPFLVMTPESAELTKYVANAMLSTKISFINEMANLCERMGGDINDVRRGIGHDRRIGFEFLFPGVGYGGSCFPKDVRALIHMAKTYDIRPLMMQAVEDTNNNQKNVLIEKINSHFDGQLKDKTFAIWGLSFKPKTDDIREAPALVLIHHLLKHGAKCRVHDPEAMPNVKAELGDKVTYCDQPLGALDGADALAINTEWNEFRQPNFPEMKRRLKVPLVFDGRNLYDPKQMAELGFVYLSIGRVKIDGTASGK